jgi:5-methylcytosine-specific restriction endonuclease McrBC GTP-binding regulatory subunit McrB
MFSWVPLYTEIADKLLSFKNDRNQLIELLSSMYEDGLKVINLNDKLESKSGPSIKITDIDPFTFFANFNRSVTVINRIAILAAIKKNWRLKEELPKDFSGLPALTPQNAWFFAYTYHRGKNDIDNLWQLYEEILTKDAKKVDGEIFNQCLNQRGVKQNLTAGLFWVKPNSYFPLVGGVEDYLSENININEIRIDKLKFSGYLELISRIKSKTNESLYKISHEAYTKAREKADDILKEDLIEKFLKSEEYYKFKTESLPVKINREKEAWKLISQNKDNITKELLSDYMQKIDTHLGKEGWFGLLLRGNNRQLILDTSIQKLNEWLNTLLFSDLDYKEALRECLLDHKIPGANYGFITLLLYSQSPEKFNVFLPSIAEKAFTLITSIDLKKYRDKIEKYQIFNHTVNLIKKKYGLKPQEIDWFLNNIKSYYENQEFYQTKNKEHEKKEINMGLNTILYGPPGTGKTYTTKNLALNILGINSTNLSREEIMEKYREYNDKGQIGFVTFHQSFGYEDFIEGIKPKLAKTEESVESKIDLAYEIKDGIFKEICEKANIAKTQSSKDSKYFIDPKKFENVKYYKMSLGNTSLEEESDIYEYCIKNNLIGLGWGDNLDFTDIKNIDEIKSVYEKAGYNIENNYDFRISAIKMFSFWMKEGDIVFISNGNKNLRAVGKIKSEYKFLPNVPISYCQFREVEWLLKDVEIPIKSIYYKNFSQQAIYQMFDNKVNTSLFINTNEKKDPDKFILIIDEINRGNIASIFGELITLIEEDKREGASEAISAILPYSKEEFSVPDNLYIIGTMNTADRSVEALDTALRRRFNFTEVVPDYSLLTHANLIIRLWAKYDSSTWNKEPFRSKANSLYEFLGIDDFDEQLVYDKIDFNSDDNSKHFENLTFSGLDPSKLLKAINDRIELVLDRDHCIGHSYFLKLIDSDNPFAMLRNIFNNNIIPLLQEYFYGNPSKIGLVLGNKFVLKTKSDNDLVKGFEDDYDYDDTKTLYKIVIPESIDDFRSIYE